MPQLVSCPPECTERKRVATLDFFPLSHDFCTAAVQNQMTKFTLEIVENQRNFPTLWRIIFVRHCAISYYIPWIYRW